MHTVSTAFIRTQMQLYSTNKKNIVTKRHVLKIDRHSTISVRVTRQIFVDFMITQQSDCKHGAITKLKRFIQIKCKKYFRSKKSKHYFGHNSLVLALSFSFYIQFCFCREFVFDHRMFVFVFGNI